MWIAGVQEHETPEAPATTPAAKAEPTSPGRHLSDRDVQKLILVTPSRASKGSRGEEEAAATREGPSSSEVWWDVDRPKPPRYNQCSGLASDWSHQFARCNMALCCWRCSALPW